MQAQSRGFLLNHARQPDLHQTLRGAKLEDLKPLHTGSLSLRAIAWRVIGGLAIIGVAWTLFVVATRPRARHAIVEWITFGIGAADRRDVGTN